MNVGILGAGGIARMMAQTLNKMDDAVAYAIGSRNKDKAESFADEYGIEKAYDSYEAFLQDPAIDLVYIATPHSHHFTHGKLCLEHEKPILVEKSFTVNEKQAKELIALGKEKKLLVAEAIWTRYMPSRTIINDLIASEIIGEVTAVTANLGYLISNVERIKNPELAGGALLDVGVYPLNFASMVLGNDIKDITTTAIMMDSGVDAQNSVTLTYKNGAMALLHSTTLSQTDRKGIIYGTKGTILAHNINNIEKITVYDLDRKAINIIDVPKQITGYEYQVIECQEALKAGKLEVDSMPHLETIEIMKLMDDIRAQWGLVYPFEK